MLSPIQRQVAHALLTRPPLSYSDASRRIDLNNSVRLECVMHAASVHPEPGSNSRMFCILNATLLGNIYYLLYSSFFILAFLLLLSIYNSIDEISFSHLQCFVLLSCCSIFNDRATRSSGQLDYYITSLFLCQHFFAKNFKFFYYCIS